MITMSTIVMLGVSLPPLATVVMMIRAWFVLLVDDVLSELEIFLALSTKVLSVVDRVFSVLVETGEKEISGVFSVVVVPMVMSLVVVGTVVMRFNSRASDSGSFRRTRVSR